METDNILDLINKFENKLVVKVAVYKRVSVVSEKQLLNTITKTLSLLRKEYLLGTEEDESRFASIIKFILKIKQIDAPSLWESFCGKDMTPEDILKFLVGEYYGYHEAL